MSVRPSHAHVVCFYGITGEPWMEFHEDLGWLVSMYDPAVSSSLARDEVQSIAGYFRTTGADLERVAEADVAAAIAAANEEAAEWEFVDDPAVRPYTVRLHGPPGFTCTTGSYRKREHAQQYGVDDLPASLRPVIIRRDGAPIETSPDHTTEDYRP